MSDESFAWFIGGIFYGLALAYIGHFLVPIFQELRRRSK